MQSEQTYTIPPLSKWLLDAATLVAPRPVRSAWKREWLWEIWHGHATLVREGTPPTRAGRRVARFALGAFLDAADLRLEHVRTNFDARALARDPIPCLAGLALAFLMLAAWTSGFHHSRAALAPAYPASGELVLLSRPLGVLGMEVPASGGQVSTWVDESHWFGDVAGFVLLDDTLVVTPNFFSVLKAIPSQDFRFLGHKVAAVTLLNPQGPPLRFSGALARLKHPADRKAAEAHFARFSISDGLPVNTTFLRQRIRWPFYCAGVLCPLAVAAGMLRSRRSLRYTGFFAAKTGLLLGIVAAAWVEVATALPIPISGGVDPGTAATMVLLFLFSLAFAMRWSLEDQASRCPVCCRLVSMPVSVGSRSSLLLDRPGIEMLCTRGHGTLLISDLTACTGERSRWTPSDHSWQEVFVQSKTA